MLACNVFLMHMCDMFQAWMLHLEHLGLEATSGTAA